MVRVQLLRVHADASLSDEGQVDSVRLDAERGGRVAPPQLADQLVGARILALEMFHVVDETADYYPGAALFVMVLKVASGNGKVTSL